MDHVHPPLDRGVFAIGDQTFQWGDVLAAAGAWGDSGTLERVAIRLAEGMAAHQALGGTGRPTTVELDQAVQQFARVSAGSDRIEKTIAEHQLPWTTLELSAIDLAVEDAARGALHGLRSDRRSLDELAAQAGVRVKRVRTTLEELPAQLRPYFVSAKPGEVLGPLKVPDAWRVVVVDGRREPSPADEAMVRRALEHVARPALRRERERRVRWLDPVAI